MLKVKHSGGTKYFSGKTQAECNQKRREWERMGGNIDTTTATVEQYAWYWMQTFKQPTLKQSSFDRLEKTAKHQIIPILGNVKLKKLKADQIQQMLSVIAESQSYSTVKKAHDFMNGMLKHAKAAGDISSNPMDMVQMLSRAKFEKETEHRFFTDDECRIITEECLRTYSNGEPVYPYGDAYILALHTGLRKGELTGLEWDDWNEADNYLFVRRSVQSVKKRDKNGNATKGYELVTTEPKTKNGKRKVPLNSSAIAALRRMREAHPDSKTIVCNTKGKIVPPDHLNRTLNRVLDNAGIERTGMHTFRHTFASRLFAKGADVKTVSKYLGHSSVQVTYDTYIHLIEKTDTSVVDLLDSFEERTA